MLPPAVALRRRAALLAALLATVPGLVAAQDGITVSAAASLAEAMRELAAGFEARHPGVAVRLNTGASGALLQQAARGAPVDVLASADEATIDEAVQRGLVEPGQRRIFASNRLVVIVPVDSDLKLPSLRDLAKPGVQRVAIGSPASVPAGRYARAALQAAGVWEALQSRLIGAQSVRQVLDYVVRREVDAGLVYATDARLRPDRLRVAVADAAPGLPLRYAIAVLRASTSPGLARAFVDHVMTAEAQAVLARHGFLPPG